MKLTKEECLKALESLKPMTIKEFREKEYLPFIGANRILTQLINEHFDGSRELVKDIAELIREKKQLEKALTLACEDIADVFGNCPLDQFDCFTEKCERCDNNSKECWKEYYMSEVFGDENIQ